MIAYRSTLLGPIGIAAEDECVIRLYLPNQIEEQPFAESADTPLIREAYEQIESYFAGRLQKFDLPLAPAGTPFMREVWSALRDVPYGRTASYKEIAAAVGRPRAMRAVGMANHRNPIPILIPCHRIVGAGGSLVGYAGGLDFKRRLLTLEERYGVSI